MTLKMLKEEAKKHAEKHTDAFLAKPLQWSNSEWRTYLIWYGRFSELVSNKLKIENFLNSKKKQIELDHISPKELSHILENLGAKMNDDFEMNGWQYDWLWDATYKNIKLSLFGCGYEGTVQITKENK